jgi:hypothetical protein
MKFLESSVGRWLKEGSNETLKFRQGTFRNITTSARPAVHDKQKDAVTEQPAVYTSVLQTDSYGMDGRAIESRWGAKFTAPVQIGHGAHPPSDTISSGLKRPGRSFSHPLPSSAQVKERVELYLYKPSVSCEVIR